MFDLGLLGTTRVPPPTTADTASLLSRRKHFGLLVYLAMDPGSYHRRSVLCGLLWPETDDARARGSLRVALHHLREYLGTEAIRARDDGALGVDPTSVTSDVVRLREAIERGNAAEVARLYRGPFLGGFHTGEDPFDRWLEEERLSLERMASDAIQSGAADALSRGEWLHASALATELLRIRPTAISGIEIRVEALRELRSVGRALEDLERFRKTFEKELELPAPDRIDELEEEIRTAPREVENEAGGPTDATTPTSEPEAPEVVDASGEERDTGPAPSPTSDPAQRPSGGGLRRPRASTLAGLILMGAVGVFTFLQLAQPGDADPSDASFAASPHVPTSQAQRLLEEGRELRNGGAFADAVDIYRAVVEEDPEWGQAYLELALAAQWAGQADVSNGALDEAVARLDGMDALTRDLTVAMDLLRSGEILAARDRYMDALDAAPDDVHASMELAELEYHWGPTVGVPPETSRPRFEQVFSLTGSEQALLHLARLDARAGDAADLGGRLASLEEIEADAELREVRVLDALFGGAPYVPPDIDVGLLQSVAAAGAPPGAREAFFEAVVQDASSDRVRALGRIFRALVALEGGRLQEAEEWFDGLAQYSEARRDELVAFALTIPFRPPEPVRRRAMARRMEARSGDILIGPTAAELPSPAIYAPRRVFLQSLLRGSGRTDPDTTAFNSIAQRSWADTAHINHAMRVLRARTLMEASMDLEDALAALGPPAVHPGRVYPSVLSYPVAYERYLRARILHTLGREREALAWYRTFPDPRGYDIAFLPGILLGRAGVERTLGMTDEARATLTRMLALLEDADPAHRSLATLGRTMLADLEQ